MLSEPHFCVTKLVAALYAFIVEIFILWKFEIREFQDSYFLKG